MHPLPIRPTDEVAGYLEQVSRASSDSTVAGEGHALGEASKPGKNIHSLHLTAYLHRLENAGPGKMSSLVNFQKSIQWRSTSSKESSQRASMGDRTCKTTSWP